MYKILIDVHGGAGAGGETEARGEVGSRDQYVTKPLLSCRTESGHFQPHSAGQELGSF